jgi:UvrD-like helicase family protein
LTSFRSDTIEEFPVMGFAPTAEQAAIRDAARVEQDLIVEAGAGAGKTSTLRLLGNDQPNDKCLYVAYNKSTQIEAQASFPPNVRCRTAHALAYAGTIGRYGDRVSKARMGSIPSRELMERLRIWEPFDLGGKHDPLTPKTIAEMVARTLTRFTTSGDSRVTSFHMPRVAGLEDDTAKALAEHVAGFAELAWADYTKVNGVLTFTPNVYLKLWQLTRPRLRFDTIFFDEAQDANGAMAAIVNGQSCRRRAVGDSCQAINGWNGAVDAMAKWDWPRLMLTQSFRFGPRIANLANLWLGSLRAPLRLSGLESIDSRIVSRLSEPTAILCRTNMGVIDAALGQLGQDRRVAVVGGIGDAALLAQAAADLRNGRRTTHPDLAAFRSWEEFSSFVRTDPDGEDFRVLVSLVETYGTDQILALKRNLCDREADAQVTVSTCHKSKGREWDSVLIGQDFTPRSDEETGDPLPLTREQKMLAYVAVTRAKREICPGPLASAE